MKEVLAYILEDSYRITSKDLTERLSKLKSCEELIISIKKTLVSNDINQIYKCCNVLNHLLKLKVSLDKHLDDIVNILLQLSQNNNELINLHLLNLLYNIVVYLSKNNVNYNLLNLILTNITRVNDHDLLKNNIIVKIYSGYAFNNKVNQVNLNVLYNILNSTNCSDNSTDEVNNGDYTKLSVESLKEEIYSIIYKINPLDDIINSDINYILYLFKQLNTLKTANNRNTSYTINTYNIYNLLLTHLNNNKVTASCPKDNDFLRFNDPSKVVIEVMKQIVELLNKDLFLLQINYILTITNTLLNDGHSIRNFSGDIYKLLKLINNKCVDFNLKLNVNELRKLVLSTEFNEFLSHNSVEDILLLYVYACNDICEIEEMIKKLIEHNTRLRNDEIYLVLLNKYTSNNNFDNKLLMQVFDYIKRVNVNNELIRNHLINFLNK